MNMERWVFKIAFAALITTTKSFQNLGALAPKAPLNPYHGLTKKRGRKGAFADYWDGVNNHGLMAQQNN